jgi:shikimate kinase
VSGAIVLIGAMGSGKSEVGAALARRLNRVFIDTDELVERRAGKSIASIFEEEGEAGFRKREAEAVREAALTRSSVIACGGGVVLDPANVGRLRSSGSLVYLKVTPSVAASRVRGDIERPLLAGQESEARLNELIEQRRTAYEAAADVTVNADRDLEDVVADILELGLGGPIPRSPDPQRGSSGIGGSAS